MYRQRQELRHVFWHGISTSLFVYEKECCIRRWGKLAHSFSVTWVYQTFLFLPCNKYGIGRHVKICWSTGDKHKYSFWNKDKKTCLKDSFTAQIASVFDKITICFPLSESFPIVNYYTSKWVKDIRSHRMTNPMTIR